MASPVIHIPGYEYVRELGVGGMATVYLAIQRSLDRSVAIKVMKRAGADENFEKRFLLEGRTMAKLPHRNIVGVYDIVQNDEINYIAMEYLGGGTLSDRMRAGLSLAEAIAIVVQVAGALQFAHDSGVVHRDLKPANIMFRDAHTPVLTDFGIARAKDSQSTRLTQTGMMIGTPTYMSPEQAMGQDVDGRSDQYSLGVMFFEMLTGAAPFGGETPLNVVLAHINQPPPPLPAPFTHFQPVLDRMLAKDKEQRYPDLNVFVRELKTMLTHSDTLMAKLQIDPSQSASEQLRALGFSESQINTGSRSRIEPLRTSGQRPGPRQTGPGVRMEPDLPPPSSRPRWLVPAAAAALLLVAVLVGWFLLGRDQLDPAVRALVERALLDVDRQITEGKLVAPPGDNANESLQQVMQAAPDLPEALERQQKLIAALKALALKALETKNFAAAEIRAGEALGVAPDDPEVRGLQQRIAAAKLGAEREARAAALVQRSEAARKAGRLYGENADTALTLVRQALEVDPQHVASKAQLSAITTQALASANAALKAGKLDEAEQLLEATAAYFSSEPGWRDANTALEQARGKAQQQERIDGFLAQAYAHAEAGRYAEPAGDNALEALARVAELDKANTKAAALRREIGVALARQAQQAEQKGDLLQAMGRYDQALLAQPDNAEYSQARSALQLRLGERESQLLAALGNARSAINARRYLAPAGDNAREYLDAALKLDPANADARRLRDGLPELVRDAATELGTKEQRYDDAIALLAEATRQYPADPQFAALSRSFERERDRVRGEAQREQRLAELRELLARGQLSADSAGAIGGALGGLLQADPQDADALRLREQFVAALSAAIAAADAPARLTALEPVIAAAEKGLGARSVEMTSLRAEQAAATKALAEKEQARLASISGTLLLNAYPWADVESVVDQASNQTVTLPRDRATPLRITLPQGTYRVTFRHPQVRAPVALVATVAAQKQQVANATFPTLSARDYLKRAGYAQ
jgi:serine/threonine-protein kinase PpkA